MRDETMADAACFSPTMGRRIRVMCAAIRGRESLTKVRGNACAVLKMMRNTLPRLMLQLVTPLSSCATTLWILLLLQCSGFNALDVSVTKTRIRLRTFCSSAKAVFQKISVCKPVRTRTIFAILDRVLRAR
jgi:hypothetical protein